VVLNYIFIKRYGYCAAAYTTLVCYIVYVMAHYLFMRRICNQYMNGVVVYKPSVLLTVFTVFLAAGFALMMTYNYPVFRYSVIALMLLAMILWRKRIVRAFRHIMSLRKAR
jgi:O-antigen/teichoic acid export membrane protein